MANKKSKNYVAAKALVTKDIYTLSEALELLPQTSKVKFDASVEMHVNTGLDPKHADQILRFTTSLPHGTGKKYKVVAFVPDEMVADAKSAGAIDAGLEDLVTKVAGGFMDFDYAVAHPTVMKDLAKIAKQLGQARKMPTPKNGTVSANVVEAINNIMQGQVEVRVDKFGSTHSLVGKLSFGADKLSENIKVLVEGIKKNKPEGSKGTYIKSVHLASTMGPGLKVDVSEI